VSSPPRSRRGSVRRGNGRYSGDGVGAVGQLVDLAGGGARGRAEDGGNGRSVGGVELASPFRRFNDRGPGQAKPHAGHERNPFRGAGKHGGAAEHVADADREHGHTGDSQLEKCGERAGERPFGSVGLVQSNAAGGRKEDDASRTLGPRYLEEPPQGVGMIGTGAAPEEPIVLRGEEHARAADRCARDDNAVVVPER
jgi:hypothetical protein